MEDDQNASDDDRIIELSSISAIYPELKISPTNQFSSCLEIPVVLSSPLTVVFDVCLVAESTAPRPVSLLTPPSSTEATTEQEESGNAKAGAVDSRLVDSGGEVDSHQISYLPPLLLQITLPDGYPTEKPPVFNIKTDPPWLPEVHIKRLEKYGSKLWEDIHDQILYDYIVYLEDCAQEMFGIPREEEQLKINRELKISILDFDIRAKREVFEKSTFDCGVCLEAKKGAVCHRLLLCSHVFCVECLQDYYNSSISEGDVDNVKCMDPGCGQEWKEVQSASGRLKKQDRTLNPSELLQIPLEQSVVQRYVTLKRKKKLESDPTVAYCPRQWCQGAARSKKHPKITDLFSDNEIWEESEEEPLGSATYDPNSETGELPPMADRLAICEDCSYAFCLVCKKGWHGELASCFPRKQAELNAEEEASAQYLALHTAKCPTCQAPCQKTMGCNHMICFKCRTHFCYLCSAWLNQRNPYTHFNDTTSSCYMRLWELEGGDGGEGEVGLGFGGGAIDGDQEHEALMLWANGDESSDTDDDIDADEIDWSDGELDEPMPQGIAHRAPPPAPNPPRAPAQAARAPNANPANAGRGRGRLADEQANIPRGQRQQGIQRFLAMAQNDDEDEWDSDEIGEGTEEDDDFEDF